MYTIARLHVNMAPRVNSELLEAELNKLKKVDLIAIIINKRVPDDVNLSDEVIRGLGFNCECDLPGRTGETSACGVMISGANLKLECELRVANSEVNASKRLISQMERTIDYQEQVICLLKSGKHGEVRQAVRDMEAGPGSVAGVSRKSVRVNNSSNGEIPKKDDKATNSQTNNNMHARADRSAAVSAEDKQMQQSKRPNSIIWGSGENNQLKPNESAASVTFAAVTRKAWFYVGRIRHGTKPEQLRDYLKAKFPEQDFIVEALPTRENAGSVSFKVGADLSLVDQLNQASMWPKDVAVKKFRFFRRKVTRFSE